MPRTFELFRIRKSVKNFVKILSDYVPVTSQCFNILLETRSSVSVLVKKNSFEIENRRHPDKERRDCKEDIDEKHSGKLRLNVAESLLLAN